LRKDTGPTSDRLLIFFTDVQRNIMENATVSFYKIYLLIIKNSVILQEFFIDGTFKVVPEIFYQLFAIHANYREHVLPVSFILLPGKSGQIYQKMINEIIALVPGWSPRRIMMDFEKALINVFSGAFPTAELSGCFFHLSQSVQRYLQVRFFSKINTNSIFISSFVFRIIVSRKIMKQILYLLIIYIRYWHKRFLNQIKLLMALNVYVQILAMNTNKFSTTLKILISVVLLDAQDEQQCFLLTCGIWQCV
jgi:hypothetical protein